MKRNELLIPRNELYLYDSVDTTALASLARKIKTQPLDSDPKPVFVVGPHASGKSALAKRGLNDDPRFNFFDTGPLLRSYHAQDNPDASFGEWVSSNEEDHGPAFTDDVLAGHVLAAMGRATRLHRPVVIGNRSVDGIDRMTSSLQATQRKIVYVDAPVDLLHERYQNREQRSVSTSEFEDILERDRQMGLGELANVADIVIQNDGSIEDAAHELRTAVID